MRYPLLLLAALVGCTVPETIRENPEKLIIPVESITESEKTKVITIIVKPAPVIITPAPQVTVTNKTPCAAVNAGDGGLQQIKDLTDCLKAH